MRKATVAFEWQELHEHQEFPPLGTASSAPGQIFGFGRKRQGLIVIGGALCLLVAALLTVTWVKRQAEAGLAEIQDELMLAVDAELWQAGSGQPQRDASIGAAALPTPTRRNLASLPWSWYGDAEIIPQTAVPAEYQATLNNPAEISPKGQSQGVIARQEKVLSVVVEALRQDVVAVTVVTEAKLAGNAPPATYRQLRFYRTTDAGWQPAAPQPVLWGQPQHLATEYFDITYRSRDAQAVQVVAAELDALYEEIRKNLGLSIVSTSQMMDEKIAIEVVVGETCNRHACSGADADRLLVSSPILLRTPTFLTDAEILRRSFLPHLVDKVIQEATDTHTVPPHWRPMLSAMRLWQTWESDVSLAARHAPVISTLYADIPVVHGDTAPALLPKYAGLCALYSVWEITLVDGRASLLCNVRDRLAWQGHADRETLRFEDFVRLPSYWALLERPYDPYGEQGEHIYPLGWFESFLMATWLDYVITTYGRARIGMLWTVLHKHDDWETLIPTVFGVSAAEFEANWQAHIADGLDN
jgi:hypothetical protein